MYKILFDMRNDINDLKKLTLDLLKSEDTIKVQKRESTTYSKNLRRQT